MKKIFIMVFLLLFPLTFLYSGKCIDGNCINGYGIYTWSDGAKYAGEWKNENPHGWGFFTFANGDKYIGELRNGVPHGKGTYIWIKKRRRFVGEWKNGEMDKVGEKAKGMYINSTKPLEESRCTRGDCKNGYGTYTWTCGSKYVGEWKNGKMHGKGILKWADRKTIREGVWKNGSFMDK